MKSLSATSASGMAAGQPAKNSTSETPPSAIGDRVLRLREVTRVVGLSRATIYRRIETGGFPRPLRLGGGAAVGWLWSDLQCWLLSCRAEA